MGQTRVIQMFFGMAAVLLAGASLGDATKFQELMDPAVFPEAQRGMVVEQAVIENDRLRITTTGAELITDTSGKVVFRQRIGHARDVVELELNTEFKGDAELLHTGAGFAFARFHVPQFDLRANGDSLFMIHAQEPLNITVRRRIDVGFTASHKANHLILDEWGGFGLYCSLQDIEDAFDPLGEVTAHYVLPTGAVLWVAVCPPKLYPWEQSLKDHVVWHWSNQVGYPPDAELTRWAKKGNIILLQSEVLLWKDWNLAFEPRLGLEEFARVRETVHEAGARFIVYTSPAYFFKGTPFEQHALNSFEGFQGWPPANGSGENIDLFMAEIGKVMKEYKPDGLYFDGQYFDNPAGLYALARRTRALLGEQGILEWHSTTALGPGLCYLPQADAYVDFILRGEGRDTQYANRDYLRYFVSGYNASNSIGVLCCNGPSPETETIKSLVRLNGRLHTLAPWLDDAGMMKRLDEFYFSELNDALEAKVDAVLNDRQAQVAERMASSVK